MNAESSPFTTGQAPHRAGDARRDLSNPNVREDLAEKGRCGLVHLPTGRTCLLPLRHHGPCEFHRPQEAEDMARGT
ncbi:hypothetical protein [Pseudarthrobacter sp. NamE5]|uniref:hypothetical protein n=1 Tax=Pseudarthrobacter sp. NamE5 TaxID=2576839 RepID=UPI00110A24F6|nr:hypothetical protein [Pseudarthrobacter sp. NamE5]TLM88113.1 hypothetical protein FDW84_00890 [Pseudarthrobacter sp. NamE5]